MIAPRSNLKGLPPTAIFKNSCFTFMFYTPSFHIRFPFNKAIHSFKRSLKTPTFWIKSTLIQQSSYLTNHHLHLFPLPWTLHICSCNTWYSLHSWHTRFCFHTSCHVLQVTGSLPPIHLLIRTQPSRFCSSCETLPIPLNKLS